MPKAKCRLPKPVNAGHALRARTVTVVVRVDLEAVLAVIVVVVLAVVAAIAAVAPVAPAVMTRRLLLLRPPSKDTLYPFQHSALISVYGDASQSSKVPQVPAREP